ncbi:MAG: 2-succinyl-5-enolpyruvyl-6-hydroxy-3-cyclohexene-1-carboxylic-acid synthase [Acidimicrobiales bacterium]
MSPQHAFCTTLVDEWVRHGAAHAVVAPGSRSTPLALALAERPELTLHVVLDERSAAFVALGIGRATGTPAVLLCTSGTAAVGFHAAVVEAALSRVPMLVCTADRPPELHRVGAPQAIEQVGLFGRSPVWSADVDPLAWPATSWRSLASRAAVESGGGPVHLNMRFREPFLEGAGGEVPPARPAGRPWHQRLGPKALARLGGEGLEGIELAGLRRVLVVAGDGCDRRAPEAAAGPWPVLADPLSGWRVPGPATISAFDAVTRHAPPDGDLAPDLVLHLGRPPASRALGEWFDRGDSLHVLVDEGGRWLDPSRRADAVVVARPEASALREWQSALPPAEPGWLAGWQKAEAAAQRAIDKVLADHPEVTEPGLARDVAAHLPDGAALFVSSSMPVRDVEWFVEPRHGLEVHANRGANGIDGVTSTALGLALAREGRPTAVLLGDLAFLHDGGGLAGLGARPCSLVIVVIDNNGGGIFSFLPQARSLPSERFEQLFGTPQPVDLHALAAAHGIPSVGVDTAAELGVRLHEAIAAGGVRLLVARTNRSANVQLHQELADAVGEALGHR